MESLEAIQSITKSLQLVPYQKNELFVEKNHWKKKKNQELALRFCYYVVVLE